MIPTTCLSESFILNDKIESSNNFQPKVLNQGTVVYEVIRVIDGSLLFYQQHIDRFYYSLTNSGLKLDLSKKSLALRLKILLETNKLKEGNIRFQVDFTIDNKATFSAWACQYFYPQKELYKRGASIATMVAQRVNPNIKVYNPNLISKALSHINKNEIYEVLYLNKNGIITECSRSNIFFVLGNKITTPTLTSVLPGITRLKVIEIAKALNIDCKEENINYNSLKLFNGAFITGTSPKVLPVGKIDKITFDAEYPTITRIMKKYNEMVIRDIESFSWSQFT